MTRKLPALVGCLAILACGTAEPDIRLMVTTDRDSYTLIGAHANVGITVENVGDRGVALSGCPQPPFTVIEYRSHGRWHEEGSHGIICQAIYTTRTIALQPGTRLAYNVSVSRPGRYRLRVLAGVDPAHADAVAVSNEFMVE
jgi:hypothetical protein